MKPRHLVQPLSQFEEEVYDYFEYYSTRPAKTATKHLYLPTADKLYRFPEIKRILVVPLALGQEVGIIYAKSVMCAIRVRDIIIAIISYYVACRILKEMMQKLMRRPWILKDFQYLVPLSKLCVVYI